MGVKVKGSGERKEKEDQAMTEHEAGRSDVLP
jgi:hypothetical protein